MNPNRTKATIGVVIAVASFLNFGLSTPLGMKFKEELMLFTYHSDYILSYFSRPGSLACLVGDFFTQFLFDRWIGAAMMALVLLAGYRLASCTLRRFFPSGNTVDMLALLPVFLELLAAGSVTWSLSTPVGWMIAAAAFCGYTRTSNTRYGRLAAQLVGSAALYVATGAAALVFALLVAAYEGRNGKGRLIPAACMILWIYALCSLLRSWYMLPFSQAFWYPYSLWEQAIGPLALVALAAASYIPGARKELSRTVEVVLAMFLTIGFNIMLITLYPRKVEDVLRISSLAAEGKWDAVLKAGRKAQDPVIASYVNMALSSQGTMGDRLMEFYQPSSSGLFLEVSPSAGWWTIYFASDAYFHVGDMTMAQHSAMLGMIFSPRERSVRLVKRLAEISIVTGDIPAAMKYIDMLSLTLFHRREADKLRAQALSPDPEIISARGRIHSEDIIRDPWPPVASLESLARNPENAAARDYLLAFHLLHKNIPAFFNSYTLYYSTSEARPPKVWAEALLIYLAATGATADRVRALNIDPALMRAFADYTRTHEQSGGNMKLLQQRFPQSYWVYYHFATFK